MRVLRTVREHDVDSIHELLEANRAELTGMISLPQTRSALVERVEHSVHTVARAAHAKLSVAPGRLALRQAADPVLFVLTEGDRAIGVTGVTIDGGTELSVLRVTLDDAADGLALRLMVERLPRVELGATFLAPEARGTGAGSLLSKGRLLWLSHLVDQLPERLLSHIRGRIDGRGDSRLWDVFGAPVFGVNAASALGSASRMGRSCYLAPLVGATLPLSLASTVAIGRPHDASLPALRLLAREGLTPNGMFDPFDGGPTIVAWLRDTAVVRAATELRVAPTTGRETTPALVSRPGITDFGAVSVGVDMDAPGCVALDDAARRALGADHGSLVLVSASRGRVAAADPGAAHRGAA